MDARGKVVTAALIWTGAAFEEGIQVRVDSSGRITAVGKEILQPDETLLDFGKKALLPGFVNAHSHAFHRRMRGKSEIGSSSSESFWKWRDNMYAIVQTITRETLYKFSLETFKEMLSAGITTVGEFHYMHHGEARFSLDTAVLDAARDAGIRIALIDTLYCKAGFANQQPAEAQKRFFAPIDEFLQSVEALEKVKSDTQTIAVAAHSLRAVSLEDCKRLAKWSSERKIPMHIHVEEQPKEIAECMAANGDTPSQLVIRNALCDNLTLTAVHCSFTTRESMQALADNSTYVCVCPLTEGYLGDGVPNIVEKSRVCLGTDCNNRICMLEEMRMLTYCQHLKTNSRNVCNLNAQKLLEIVTHNGAASLGLSKSIGDFHIGKQLDFVAFQLESPRLDVPRQELLDAIVFGAGNADISATVVSGRVVYQRQA